MGKNLLPLWAVILYLFTFSNAIAVRILTDNTAPNITLNGDSRITIEVGNHHYSDAGVTTTDNTKGAITVTTLSDVNTTKAGIYTVTYIAEDSSRNRAKAIRSVEVVDKISPEMTLNGDEIVVIEVGNDYFDAGVRCTDNSSDAIAITSNISINTKVVGEYVVNYTATDPSGNKASISRKVVVAELDEKPAIVVSDDNNSVNSHLVNDNSVSINEPKGAGGSFALYWFWLSGLVLILARGRGLIRVFIGLRKYLL